MATTITREERLSAPMGMSAAAAAPVGMRDPRYQAYWMLRIAFTAIPLTMGIDKFFNGLVYWPKYLADWIANIPPGTPQQIMYGVGVVEIIAGVLVALKPRYAAYVVAAWLFFIIVNLLVLGQYFDIALRDFGLMLAAIALGRLAQGVHAWKAR